MKEKYPIYLKYPNDQIFIKIIDDNEWEEVRYMGSKKSIKSFKAVIFSDRIYLNDLMSYLDQGLLLLIDVKEYNKHLLGL